MFVLPIPHWVSGDKCGCHENSVMLFNGNLSLIIIIFIVSLVGRWALNFLHVFTKSSISCMRNLLFLMNSIFLPLFLPLKLESARFQTSLVYNVTMACLLLVYTGKLNLDQLTQAQPQTLRNIKVYYEFTLWYRTKPFFSSGSISSK